jgi:hypothetical protein
VAEDPLRRGAMLWIGAVFLLLIVCTALGTKRLRAQGLDIDDRKPLED